jgi:hypothetical protein
VPKSFRLTAWDCLQILTKKFSDQQVRMVVEFDGDDANEEVVNRFLDFYKD